MRKNTTPWLIVDKDHFDLDDWQDIILTPKKDNAFRVSKGGNNAPRSINEFVKKNDTFHILVRSSQFPRFKTYTFHQTKTKGKHIQKDDRSKDYSRAFPTFILLTPSVPVDFQSAYAELELTRLIEFTEEEYIIIDSCLEKAEQKLDIQLYPDTNSNDSDDTDSSDSEDKHKKCQCPEYFISALRSLNSYVDLIKDKLEEEKLKKVQLHCQWVQSYLSSFIRTVKDKFGTKSSRRSSVYGSDQSSESSGSSDDSSDRARKKTENKSRRRANLSVSSNDDSVDQDRQKSIKGSGHSSNSSESSSSGDDSASNDDSANHDRAKSLQGPGYSTKNRTILSDSNSGSESSSSSDNSAEPYRAKSRRHSDFYDSSHSSGSSKSSDELADRDRGNGKNNRRRTDSYDGNRDTETSHGTDDSSDYNDYDSRKEFRKGKKKSGSQRSSSVR